MRWVGRVRSCNPRHLAMALVLFTLMLGDSSRSAAARSEVEPMRPTRPTALTLHVPPVQSVNEEEELRVTVRVEGGQGLTRVSADGLPPGAHWDEPARTLTFRPDFIQGGWHQDVTFTATDGRSTTRASMTLTVLDTVRPPEPRIIHQEELFCGRVSTVTPF